MVYRQEKNLCTLFQNTIRRIELFGKYKFNLYLCTQKKEITIMCTVSVKVDEAMLRDVLPELDSTAAISRWAQLLIDQHIEALAKEYADDNEVIDLETAREVTLAAVREEYARP